MGTTNSLNFQNVSIPSLGGTLSQFATGNEQIISGLGGLAESVKDFDDRKINQYNDVLKKRIFKANTLNDIDSIIEETDFSKMDENVLKDLYSTKNSLENENKSQKYKKTLLALSKTKTSEDVDKFFDENPDLSVNGIKFGLAKQDSLENKESSRNNKQALLGIYNAKTKKEIDDILKQNPDLHTNTFNIAINRGKEIDNENINSLIQKISGDNSNNLGFSLSNDSTPPNNNKDNNNNSNSLKEPSINEESSSNGKSFNNEKPLIIKEPSNNEEFVNDASGENTETTNKVEITPFIVAELEKQGKFPSGIVKKNEDGTFSYVNEEAKTVAENFGSEYQEDIRKVSNSLINKSDPKTYYKNNNESVIINNILSPFEKDFNENVKQINESNIPDIQKPLLIEKFKNNFNRSIDKNISQYALRNSVDPTNLVKILDKVNFDPERINKILFGMENQKKYLAAHKNDTMSNTEIENKYPQITKEKILVGNAVLDFNSAIEGNRYLQDYFNYNSSYNDLKGTSLGELAVDLTKKMGRSDASDLEESASDIRNTIDDDPTLKKMNITNKDIFTGIRLTAQDQSIGLFATWNDGIDEPTVINYIKKIKNPVYSKWYRERETQVKFLKDKLDKNKNSYDKLNKQIINELKNGINPTLKIKTKESIINEINNLTKEIKEVLDPKDNPIVKTENFEKWKRKTEKSLIRPTNEVNISLPLG